MRRTAMAAVGAMLCSVALGQAQMAPMDHMDHGGAQPSAPMASGPATEAQRGYVGLKGNILKAADKMPVADYASRPTPEVRTFARVVNHITEAQLRSCGAANGTKDMAKVPAETADKAAIVAALQTSFAECDKAFAALTDANIAEMFSVGQAGKRSRIGLMWGVVSHDNEQYATLALYLRLKGLVPPSSEK